MGWRDWLGLRPRIDDLARSLVAEAANRGWGEWRIEDGGATLKFGDGGRVVNLSNMYLEYAGADRADRSNLFEKYLALFAPTVEIPALWAVAQKRLYPLVRSRFDMATIAIQARVQGHEAPQLASRPWFDHLVVRLGFDTGPSIAQVRQDNIETWGVTLDEALERAIVNLKSLPAPVWHEVRPGVWQLEAEDSYQECFLLVPRAFESLPSAGRRFAIAPNRGILLATTDAAPGGLEALLDAARDSLQQSPWPMSSTLFEIDAQGAKPVRPDGVAARKLAVLERLDLAGVYADQQSVLQQALGDDVFVASYALMGSREDPDDCTSWCSWTENVVALLPSTDLIVFGRPRGAEHELLRVRWDDAARIVGDLMQPTPEDPPRTRVERFPDAAQWSALSACALG